MNIVSVKSVLSSELAMDTEDGTKLYNEIKKNLDSSQEIILDFTGIKICSPPFLSRAIGPLFADFQEEKVIKIVDSLVNLDSTGRETLEIVVEDYREYYNNPSFRHSVDQFMEKLVENDYDLSCLD